MPPIRAIPIDPSWSSEDEYVDSLLDFVTSSPLLRNLCGGVHVLDFLTRKPNIYDTVLPKPWRDWFERVSVDDVLHLILRDDLQRVSPGHVELGWKWHGHPFPPGGLVDYITNVRRHFLLRTFRRDGSSQGPSMSHQTAVGMNPKKIHEVSNFAAYVDGLSKQVSQEVGEPCSIVDFGSGQNYLGKDARV